MIKDLKTDWNKINCDKIIKKVKTNVLWLKWSSFLEYKKQGKLIIPEYQRKFCWTEEQQLNLIKSILNWIPISPIIIRENAAWTFDLNVRIIDWQQRVTTIINFLEKCNNKELVDYIAREHCNVISVLDLWNLKEEEYYHLINYSWTPHL